MGVRGARGARTLQNVAQHQGQHGLRTAQRLGRVLRDGDSVASLAGGISCCAAQRAYLCLQRAGCRLHRPNVVRIIDGNINGTVGRVGGSPRAHGGTAAASDSPRTARGTGAARAGTAQLPHQRLEGMRLRVAALVALRTALQSGGSCCCSRSCRDRAWRLAARRRRCRARHGRAPRRPRQCLHLRAQREQLALQLRWPSTQVRHGGSLRRPRWTAAPTYQLAVAAATTMAPPRGATPYLPPAASARAAQRPHLGAEAMS